MPIDLAALIDPRTTALLLQECQEGVIGKQSALPEIARAAQRELMRRVWCARRTPRARA